MKCNYFAYFLKNRNDDSKVRFDLKPVIDAFIDNCDMGLKSSIKHSGENLYLIRHFDDVYFFIITRNQEIMKAVNTNTLTVSQISSLLNENQQLGFASYIILKNDHFGFATTLFSPRIDAFGVFVQQVLDLTNHSMWEFVPKAILRQMTKAEALKLPHIGRTSIEVDRNHDLAYHLMRFAMMDPNQVDEIGSFEIVIKPRKRQDIKSEVASFLNTIEDDHLKKIILRAKEEFSSLATDIYLTSSTSVYDPIKKGEEAEIAAQLSDRCRSNTMLLSKLEEFRNDDDFDENSIDTLRVYSSSDAWLALTDNLPD